MIESVVLIALARLALFLSCRSFLLKKLYNDLQHLAPQDTLPSTTATPKSAATTALHSTLAQTCFSLCFAENCILFMILMFQGLDVMDPSSRMINWRISLFVLLSTILLLVPISFSFALTLHSDTSTRSQTRSIFIRIALVLLPVGLFLSLLSYIPLPAALSSYSPLSAVTCRLVVLGTTILGLLSGLGAVSSAWGVLGRQALASSASSIASAEHALDRVRSDLRDRSREVDSYQPPPQPQASWVSRMAPFNRDSQLSSLKQEVIGLQALESEMSTRLSTLKTNQSAARFAQSFHGKFLSRVWAVYCVGRVCSSIINIVFPPSSSSETSPSSYGDIIAHLLAYLFSLLSSEGYDDVGELKVDVPSLSRQISLALVGIIILSSVRVVLRGVTRALRITSRHLSASLMLLTLAQLMGIYLLSTLVQLRTAFPPSTIPPPPPDSGQLPTVDDNTNVFTTLPAYSLFGVLFDWSFLLGAGACALARWAGGILSGDDM